ncbi:MAG: hypothetical protein ACRD5R_18440 [Candidatus Acidiferrales bacterium]
MERLVSVNGYPAGGPEEDDPRPAPVEGGWGSDLEPGADVEPAAAASSGSGTMGFHIPQQLNDQGPCLYFGPAGQRCERPALAGGFCSRHMPGAKVIKRISSPSRILAAIGAILGILWPYLADVVREIMRLMHSH